MAAGHSFRAMPFDRDRFRIVTSKDRYRLRVRVFLEVAVFLFLALVLRAGSNSRVVWAERDHQAHHRTPSGPGGAAARVKEKELSMPFRVGESLHYRVGWATFGSAASLELSVPERRELFGRPAWHLRALMHTESPVRSLFAIDDQFDSYTDAVTLESRQYEMYLNEMGRREDAVLHLIRPGETSRAPAPNVVVPPGTRDPVGALYALRSVDWQRTPEFQAPLYDGHDVYQASAKCENSAEPVAVAAGSFQASRISIRLFENGQEVPKLNFTIWLANDASRTPVEIQAELPFGSVRAELTSPSR
jgi:hypothetical protein